MSFQSLLRYLFLGFVFLLPLQTAYLLREVFVGGEKWQYGSVLIYVSDIVLLFSIIIFVLSSWKKWTLQVTSLILLILWAGFSILWAPDQVLAAYVVVKLMLAAGVFFLARSIKIDVKNIILVVMAGAIIQSGIGIAQFLSQETISSSLLGMSAHEAWQAGTSVLKNDTGRFLRAYGTFPHPNILGGFLAVVLVLGIGQLTVVGKQWLRTVLMSNSELRASGASLRDRFLDTVRLAGLVIVFATILLGLMLTFSRGAWFGAVLGILALLFHHVYHLKTKSNIIRRPSDYVTFLKILGVFGLMGMVFIGVLHETVLLRFDRAVIEHEGSVSERIQSFRDAQQIIGEGNILFGTGIGNFTTEAMRLMPERPIWTIQPAHNVLVLIFAELGLFGFVIFIIFLLSIVFNFEKSKSNIIRRSSDYVTFLKGEGVVFLVGLIVLVPVLLLDHYLWTSHFGLLFFFLLLGLASRK